MGRRSESTRRNPVPLLSSTAAMITVPISSRHLGGTSRTSSTRPMMEMAMPPSMIGSMSRSSTWPHAIAALRAAAQPRQIAAPPRYGVGRA